MAISIEMSKAQLKNFWSRVDRVDGECWEWNSGCISTGYGAFWVPPRVQLSHRISWCIHNGEIPDGLHVCHHCDNPPCANPDHLFLGTALDNSRDKHRKGRWRAAKGAEPARARFKNRDVTRIRRLFDSGNSTIADISRMYEAPHNTIRAIALRNSWRHLD